MEREEEIRLIAYNIWEGEGYSNGQDIEHWFRAEIIWEQLQKEKANVKPEREATQKPKAIGKKKSLKKV